MKGRGAYARAQAPSLPPPRAAETAVAGGGAGGGGWPLCQSQSPGQPPGRVQAGGERGDDREQHGLHERIERQRQRQRPAEGAAVDDVGQDQAGQSAERQRQQSGGQPEQAAFDGEQAQQLARQQAERAQHREFAPAFEREREQRAEHAGGGNHQRQHAQHGGDREGAIEDRQRALDDRVVRAQLDRLQRREACFESGTRRLRINARFQEHAGRGRCARCEVACGGGRVDQRAAVFGAVVGVDAGDRVAARAVVGRKREFIPRTEPQARGQRFADQHAAGIEGRPGAGRVALQQPVAGACGRRQPGDDQLHRPAVDRNLQPPVAGERGDGRIVLQCFEHARRNGGTSPPSGRAVA